jgi:uncharacterized protein YndB with AHSA1/START domain
MLSQTRVIRAPRARVYEAWTNPETMKQWFGPSAMRTPNVSLDVRVGGAYRIEFAPNQQAPSDDHDCGGTNTAAFGQYTQIVPNQLLQFSWSSNWQPGEDSLVTVSLKDVDGGTELTILHENFNTEESRDAHNNGWAGSFDKLARILEA